MKIKIELVRSMKGISLFINNTRLKDYARGVEALPALDARMIADAFNAVGIFATVTKEII